MSRRGHSGRVAVVLAEELPVLGADVVDDLEAGVLEAAPLCRSRPYLDADGCGGFLSQNFLAQDLIL